MNKITKQQLHSLQVSPQIYRWFLRRFPQGGEYQAIHHALMCDGDIEWLETLVEYSYALSFDTPAFIAQETQATEAMVAQLTSNGDGVVQIKPRAARTQHASIPASTLQLATSDSALNIGSIGLQSQVALSGSYNLVGNSGDNTSIANVGYGAQLVSSGFAVRISNTGPQSRIGSLGGRSRISNSGNSVKISSTGRGTCIANSGMRSYISSMGDATRIANAGDMCKIGITGHNNRLINSGDDVSINISGENVELLSSGKVKTLILGKGGCAALTYHDGTRTRFLVVYEGENGITAGVKYRVNSAFELEACG
ncbi:protein YdhT [Pectobacterium sp. B1J-3]|uniref:protein YdhT n=1 Tax=Pectobacterium sp. B1J-3 TaxID=3385371 RepID=UPI003905BBF2